MPVSPVDIQCLVQAARTQQVPVQIVVGLIKTEGGYVGAETPNMANGRVTSRDLGVMQVNDKAWVPVLARLHFGGNQAAAYAALRDYGCYNVNIGTWIYRQYVDEAHGNLAEAVGLYNSHTPDKKRAYQRRFAQNFLRLFGQKG